MTSPLRVLSAGVTFIFLLRGFMCRSALGPEFVKEVEITKLRLAVAFIAMAFLVPTPSVVGLPLRTIRGVQKVSRLR